MLAIPASGNQTRTIAGFEHVSSIGWKDVVCKVFSHLFARLDSGIRNLHHALNYQRTGTSTTVANPDYPDLALVVLQDTQ